MSVRDNYLNAVRTGQPTGDIGAVINSLSGDHQASDTYAFVNRLQWEDYKARLQPQVENLMNLTSYGNPDIVNKRIGEGMASASQGFATTQKMADQTMERFGISRSAGELATRQKKDKLGTARAMADSANRTRQSVRDMDRQIAFGGLGGMRPATAG